MFYYNTLKELEDLVNENKLEVWQVIEPVSYTHLTQEQ